MQPARRTGPGTSCSGWYAPSSLTSRCSTCAAGCCRRGQPRADGTRPQEERSRTEVGKRCGEAEQSAARDALHLQVGGVEAAQVGERGSGVPPAGRNRGRTPTAPAVGAAGSGTVGSRRRHGDRDRGAGGDGQHHEGQADRSAAGGHRLMLGGPVCSWPESRDVAERHRPRRHVDGVGSSAKRTARAWGEPVVARISRHAGID